MHPGNHWQQISASEMPNQNITKCDGVCCRPAATFHTHCTTTAPAYLYSALYLAAMPVNLMELRMRALAPCVMSLPKSLPGSTVPPPASDPLAAVPAACLGAAAAGAAACLASAPGGVAPPEVFDGDAAATGDPLETPADPEPLPPNMPLKKPPNPPSAWLPSGFTSSTLAAWATATSTAEPNEPLLELEPFVSAAEPGMLPEEEGVEGGVGVGVGLPKPSSRIRPVASCRVLFTSVFSAAARFSILCRRVRVLHCSNFKCRYD